MPEEHEQKADSLPAQDGTADSSTAQAGNEGSPSSDGSPESSPGEAPETMQDAVMGSLKDSMEKDEQQQEETQGDQTGEPGESQEKDAPGEGQKPEAGQDGGKPAAEEGEDLYRMPEGLKKDSQDRFKRLVDENKSAKQELEQARGNLNKIQDMVAQTGASQDQVAGMFDYLYLRNNSGDKQSLEQALDFAKNEVKALSQMLGVESEGVDLLADYPDLKEKTENYDLSREDALEIANARRLRNTQQAQNERQSSERQAADNFSRDKDAAVRDIGDMVARWEKTDLDFAAKNEILIRKSQDVFQNYPPSQWAGIFRTMYEAMGESAQMGSRKKPAQDPALPPSKQGGSGDRVPASMQDAVLMTLGVK